MAETMTVFNRRALRHHRDRAVRTIDEINFLLNAVEVLPQEQVLESLRLFAREVMPAFGSC